jgi:hypothetical protein
LSSFARRDMGFWYGLSEARFASYLNYHEEASFNDSARR